MLTVHKLLLCLTGLALCIADDEAAIGNAQLIDRFNILKLVLPLRRDQLEELHLIINNELGQEAIIPTAPENILSNVEDLAILAGEENQTESDQDEDPNSAFHSTNDSESDYRNEEFDVSKEDLEESGEFSGEPFATQEELSNSIDTTDSVEVTSGSSASFNAPSVTDEVIFDASKTSSDEIPSDEISFDQVTSTSNVVPSDVVTWDAFQQLSDKILSIIDIFEKTNRNETPSKNTQNDSSSEKPALVDFSNDDGTEVSPFPSESALTDIDLVESPSNSDLSVFSLSNADNIESSYASQYSTPFASNMGAFRTDNLENDFKISSMSETQDSQLPKDNGISVIQLADITSKRISDRRKVKEEKKKKVSKLMSDTPSREISVAPQFQFHQQDYVQLVPIPYSRPKTHWLNEVSAGENWSEDDDNIDDMRSSQRKILTDGNVSSVHHESDVQNSSEKDWSSLPVESSPSSDLSPKASSGVVPEPQGFEKLFQDSPEILDGQQLEYLRQIYMEIQKIIGNANPRSESNDQQSEDKGDQQSKDRGGQQSKDRGDQQSKDRGDQPSEDRGDQPGEDRGDQPGDQPGEYKDDQPSEDADEQVTEDDDVHDVRGNDLTVNTTVDADQMTTKSHITESPNTTKSARPIKVSRTISSLTLKTTSISRHRTYNSRRKSSRFSVPSLEKPHTKEKFSWHRLFSHHNNERNSKLMQHGFQVEEFSGTVTIQISFAVVLIGIYCWLL